MPSIAELATSTLISLTIPLLAFSGSLALLVPFIVGLRISLWPLRIVVSFFRSTPLVTQLFLAYYGLPELEWIRMSVLWPFFGQAYPCAVVVFALNGASHLAHYFLVLTRSLDRQLWPSAKALHLSRIQYWRFLAGPHAWKISQPAMRQELIQLFKAGSICSLIAINDFSSLTKDHLSNTFDPFGAYMMALSFYFLGVTGIQQVWKFKKPL